MVFETLMPCQQLMLFSWQELCRVLWQKNKTKKASIFIHLFSMGVPRQKRDEGLSVFSFLFFFSTQPSNHSGGEGGKYQPTIFASNILDNNNIILIIINNKTLSLFYLKIVSNREFSIAICIEL